MSAIETLYVKFAADGRLGRTLDFLLRQAMQAVLTQRRFADVAEAGESWSLLCPLDLLDPFVTDSAAVGISAVVVWSGSSSSILGSSSISSEMQSPRGI